MRLKIIVFLASAVLCIGNSSQIWPALADEPLHSLSGREAQLLDSKEAKSSFRLDSWSRCSAHSSNARPICIAPDDIDDPFKEYHSLALRLGNGIDDADALCAIDTAIVRLLRNCPLEFPDSYLLDMPTLAYSDLAKLLADNWQRLGELRRADQMYHQAYVMLNEEPAWSLGKLGILRQWVSLRVTLGDSDGAKDLAFLHTTIARRYYKCDGDSPLILVQSLEFQAETLSAIGYSREAEAARTEAQFLSKFPGKCSGT